MKKLTSDPTLLDVLTIWKDDIFSSLNCHAVGKIESFNSSNQRAQVSIIYSRKVSTDSETQNRLDYPLLVDVPVIIPSGGVGSLRFPISNGDFCLVLFNDRDIDNFLESGAFAQLNSDRKHSFSDGIALVGLFPSVSSLKDYKADRTELVHDQTLISIKDKIKIQNAAQNLMDILDVFLTALSTAQGVDTVTSAPVSLATLNAAATTAKTNLNLLLEKSV